MRNKQVAEAVKISLDKVSVLYRILGYNLSKLCMQSSSLLDYKGVGVVTVTPVSSSQSLVSVACQTLRKRSLLNRFILRLKSPHMRKRETRADFWLLEPLSCFLFSLTQTVTLAWAILITVISFVTGDSQPQPVLSNLQLTPRLSNRTAVTSLFLQLRLKRTRAELFYVTVL